MMNTSTLQSHNQPRPFSTSQFSCRAVIAAFIFMALLPSCKPDNLQAGSAPKYFDIKGYFDTNTALLSKRNPLVNKAVTQDSVTETKPVHIENWDAELSLFSQSDINKPAWRDSYDVDSGATGVIYRAKTLDLRTQLIVINKKGNKIKWLMIYNNSQNMLYQTSEKLSYFPDSLYIIQKYQKVRLLGANNYLVKGFLN